MVDATSRSRSRGRIEFVGGRFEQFFLCADELLLGHSALLDFGLLLLAVLLRVSGARPDTGASTYLLLLLVILRDLEYGWHVVAKVEFFECCLDMFTCDGLLRVLFGDFIRLGGNERDELDAAFNEEVSGIFGEGHARLAGEDVLDNLLYGCCDTVRGLHEPMRRMTYPLATTDRRCRRTRGQTCWENAQCVVMAVSSCTGTLDLSSSRCKNKRKARRVNFGRFAGELSSSVIASCA